MASREMTRRDDVIARRAPSLVLEGPTKRGKVGRLAESLSRRIHKCSRRVQSGHKQFNFDRRSVLSR